MKNRDFLKTAIDHVENETCIVVHACEVDKFRGNKQKTDRRYLLFTNINVLFFKIGSRPKQLSSQFWSNLVGIDGLVSQDQIMTLYFKQDTFKFKITDPQEIKTTRMKLGDLFQRIFTTEEQEMLLLNKTDLYQISCRSIQNSFGQYSRFLSYIKSNKIEIEKETERRFFTYLVYRQKEISFPKKIKPLEFESFMYGLDSLQFIESILFKEISNLDIFQQLITFYSTLFENPSIYMDRNKENDQNTPKNYQFTIRPNIRHFKFKKIKATNKFDEFIDHLTNGQIKHNLIGLSFENMKLIEKNFYSIDKLCRSLKMNQQSDKPIGLKSLSFDSSLSEDQYNYFLSSFLNKDTTRHLCMLSLNSTYNLTMPLLLDKIRNLNSLSLANCNINILTTLQCIERVKMDNLRMLNLSGNYCSKSPPPEFDKKKKKKEKKKKKNANSNGDEYNPNDNVEFDDDDIVFPQSLNVLYVRNCRWGSSFKSLIAFLKTASSFKPKTNNNNSQFMLSIRGIRGGSFDQEGEFNVSLDYFNEFNSYLAGFFTDTKRSQITHLDWAGNPISSEFIEFIRKSKKLVELDVSYCFSAELEGENMKSDQNDSKAEVTNSNSNSLLRQFSRYLVDDAKKLESLIICGKQKVTNEDDKKHEIEKSFLSQNLSGNSIYPLFEAIKETKNPLSYINITGQKLENPDGLNFFSDAIGCNQNIQKVSFKNTGIGSKEQFNYFVSKVKRSKPILVEWPSDEMKNIGDSNMAYFKNLLIHLSRKNFYYEEKPKQDKTDTEKKPKKTRKSRVDSDSDFEDFSDDGDIKFDKLLFGKNLMARKIEAFQFDTDRVFPCYFTEEVEKLISLPKEGNDEDENEAENDDKKKKKNKKDEIAKSKKKIPSDESESEESENEDKNKKKKQTNKVKKVEPDEDESEESENEDKNKKKKQPKKAKKVESDEDESEESENEDKNKKKKQTKKAKKIESDEDESEESENEDKNKKKKQTKKVKKVESDEDESEESENEDKNKKKKQTKKAKKVEPDSENEEEEDDDDDDNKNKKKKAINKKSNKKPKKAKKDDDEEEDSDDEEQEYLLKSKKKFLLSKSKKKVTNSDDDEEDEDDDDEGNKKNRKKRKVKRRGVSLSSSDSEGNDNSDNEGYDDDDEEDKEKWEFPKGIKPNKDGKKLVRNIKEKFSLENLMCNLVNG